jgi:hypothetical protein
LNVQSVGLAFGASDYNGLAANGEV